MTSPYHLSIVADMQGNFAPNAEAPEEFQRSPPWEEPKFAMRHHNNTEDDHEKEFYDALMVETMRVITDRDAK